MHRPIHNLSSQVLRSEAERLQDQMLHEGQTELTASLRKLVRACLKRGLKKMGGLWV